MIVLTFYYAGKCSTNFNTGIVESLFTSSIINSTLMFYFFYGQELGVIDLVGMACIVLCVVLIGTGGQPSNETYTPLSSAAAINGAINKEI